MIIEIVTTAGYAAQLFSLKIIKSLIAILLEDTFDSSGLLKDIVLSEISILTGDNRILEVLKSADGKESKRHIYIVTQTESDARAIERALLYWVNKPDQLKDALKQLDPEFTEPDWEGYLFESIATDISDILAATILIPPKKAFQTCFRGSASWIES
jgi:hypothetical protein